MYTKRHKNADYLVKLAEEESDPVPRNTGSHDCNFPEPVDDRLNEEIRIY